MLRDPHSNTLQRETPGRPARGRRTLNRVSQQSQDDRARDRALVDRLLVADPVAFAEIYDCYFPPVYAFILKRVGDPAEAEDLTQETFVQLYRSLPSFEGRSSLQTWTFGIAHNVCSHFYRHCSRWMVGPKDARELHDKPVEASIERRIDASRVLGRCDEVLEANRRPAHREIFHLRYGESHSIRVIAERVGKSNDAVKASLRRSRVLLSHRVPELGIVLGDLVQPA